MSLPSQLERMTRVSPRLWRGKEIPREGIETVSTGHETLDAVLPGGGWPVGALTEIIVPHWGIGELRLLLPAMAAMTRAKRWLSWIAPPYLPYGPGLLQAEVDLNFALVLDVNGCDRDLLWSMEKLLQNSASGIVMAWPQRLTSGALRRLQLTAESAGTLGFLYCLEGIQGSPAALRLQLHPMQQGLKVDILKARGSWQRQTILLSI